MRCRCCRFVYPTLSVFSFWLWWARVMFSHTHNSGVWLSVSSDKMCFLIACSQHADNTHFSHTLETTVDKVCCEKLKRAHQQIEMKQCSQTHNISVLSNEFSIHFIHSLFCIQFPAYLVCVCVFMDKIARVLWCAHAFLPFSLLGGHEPNTQNNK